MKNCLLAILLMLLTGCEAINTTNSGFNWPDNNSQFEWPEHASSPIFKELLTAYNTGKLENLQSFAKEFYSEKSVKGKDIYWSQVFSEYGPLTPYKVDEEKFHGLPAIWFQGQKTKAWLKMVIMVGKDQRTIKRVGLFRKMRPTGTLPPYTTLTGKQLSKYLPTYLDELVADDRFSGSVLIAHGNDVLFQESYGYRDLANKFKNGNDTVYRIASTTKTFTAIAIAQLVEQGKLSFADPMSKFITEYPKDIANQVTIHHLLSHTSGLEFDNYDPFYEETLNAKSIDEMLSIQVKYMDHMNDNRRNNFKVLDKFDYSNDNYVLLGAIIERASGMSYAQYLEEHIFKPTSMESSIADNRKVANHKNKAKGYSFNNKDMRFQLGDRREANGSAVANIIMPAGGLYASALNLYKFFKGINQHQLVSKETLALMTTKHGTRMSSDSAQMHLNYGYGFYLSQYEKAKSFGHGGVDYGVGSTFEYYPEQDIYVIVLSNYGSMAGNVVADHIRDLIEPNL